MGMSELNFMAIHPVVVEVLYSSVEHWDGLLILSHDEHWGQREIWSHGWIFLIWHDEDLKKGLYLVLILDLKQDGKTTPLFVQTLVEFTESLHCYI